ncbi:hypothetical protein ACIA5C_17155 [Actinoplanes sp. NPDC051343]|uniref:hypothetical protein n=1 Tax=Actinoplanes sp. NPDC051343 TaxID=3363906 RepID=UPI0037ABE4B9
MKTAHLLAAVLPILAVLAFAPAVPVLSPFLCLVAVMAVGTLWIRALIREPLTPVARLGLSVVAGLVSLPMTALVLYVVGVRIEGRGLALGLAIVAVALGAYVIVARPSIVGSPHPGHWVGPEEHPGTTKTRRLSTTAAVGVPALLALVIGGTATVVYQRLPHPAEPGYTSLALAGWAAGIARPVAIPPAGLEVPLEVSSAGEPGQTAALQVQIGRRPAGPGLPVAISPGTRPLRVHVPAPADGCLHSIRISLGAASTVFYGRGPFPARILTRRGPVAC